MSYVSILLSDSETENDELAKDLAEAANSQQMIDAGIVPDGNFLAKGGWQKIIWGFDVPEDFVIFQNYPNPFNPTTKLEFRISNHGFVSLKVYDILGKEVSTLVNSELPAGIHKVEFDGTGLPSGTYFYRLDAGNYSETKKMLLLK